MKGKNKGLITGDHFQVLCNAVGGGTVSDFLEKSIRKVYSSTLLALRGGGSQISGGGGSITEHLNAIQASDIYTSLTVTISEFIGFSMRVYPRQ